MHNPSDPHPPYEVLRERMHAHIFALTGREDIQGIEIASLIRRISNLYELIRERDIANCDLSVPRMFLLMRLAGEEHKGNHDGLTPTMLSRNQRVSRNTISALLRGLEEQGLIARQMDPDDRRGFRIRLTDLGRSTAAEFAPQMVEHQNRLAEILTPQEQSQLIDLLARLYSGLDKRLSGEPQGDAEPSLQGA